MHTILFVTNGRLCRYEPGNDVVVGDVAAVSIDEARQLARPSWAPDPIPAPARRNPIASSRPLILA